MGFFDVVKGNGDIAGFLKVDLGLKVPIGYSGWAWGDFFEHTPIEDILDAIGSIYRALNRNRPIDSSRWLEFVKRALAEESMGYRINEFGTVRVLIDEDYERARSATIAGLGSQRYESARASYAKVVETLDSPAPDTLSAIRWTFDTVEEVFKLMFAGKVSRIGPSEVAKYFKPLVLATYQGPDRDAANSMVESLSAWTVAAFNYRHAPGQELHSPPPIEIAISMVSVGASYLRWLIDLDGRALRT